MSEQTEQQLVVPTEHALCDVLVIGGGPAGTTAASLLAEKGHRVVLLEKAHHPRFHIGESLLPANMPLFERLGVADQVKAIGMEKWAAEFVSPLHAHRQRYEFADAWDKSLPYAYQVPRAEFDHILIKNAAAKGAQVIEGCKVVAIEFLPDDRGAHITGRYDDGHEATWQARFVIDASGRDTFLANRFKAKTRNPKHNSSSVYAHFTGAQRLEGKAEGNITIFWFEHGWFWFIPMLNGITSVGVVTWPYYMKTREKRSLDQFLVDTMASCPALMERMQDAKMTSEVEATGNFSYVTDHTHGTNYLLLGDAYAFIDPIFSSGVLFAMNSGVVGATAVDTYLRQPQEAPAAFREFDRQMKHGPKEFSWFIYRMNNPIMRELFMGPRNVWRVKEALLSVLAGDIFGKTPIWPSVMMFKIMFYLSSLKNLRTSLRAKKQRAINILPVDDPNMATPS